MSQNAELAREVENVVRRARLGDQNAIAMITEVRKSALAGVPKALEAFDRLQKYATQNPVGKGSPARVPPQAGRTPVHFMPGMRTAPSAPMVIGKDTMTVRMPDKDVARAVTSLANGPALTTLYAATLIASLDVPRSKAFRFALANYKDRPRVTRAADKYPQWTGAFYGGFATGKARAIQRIRDASVPLSELSDVVAWELGE